MTNNFKVSLKVRSKLIAINLETNNFKPDIGQKGKPRVYTVEAIDVGNKTFRLFQVGTYENPLWFSLETGEPFLLEHSRSSMTFKNWKNWKLINKND